jgi:hypothetical protein
VKGSGIRDYEHLIRAAAIFVIGLAVFLVVRHSLVPEGFGALGHYRPGALTDIRMRPVSFAGAQACRECHEDEATVHDAGRHAKVRCEACHGPLAAHVSDPGAAPTVLPLPPPGLCIRCHEKNVAKPVGFPQVDSKEHAGEENCASCHQPHDPAIK